MDSRLRGNDGLAVSQGPLQARGLLEAFNAGAAERELRNERGLPISFVPQGDLPEGRAYEEFIGATGCVPTRENLHDFFNALVWLSFPRIKRQLNALQAAQIALAGIGKSRGPARDGATIFDENSALLVVRDTPEGAQLVEALRAHEWRAALYERRAMFGRDAQVWLFGHALMEKLVAPRKAMTAHTRVLKAGPDYFALTHDAQRAWIDEHVARELAAEGLSTACFTPLPVLGVPGWWEGQGEDFYADTSVFRQKRSRNP
ncbi:MAG: DUF3025 domain-containing protein [Telluria sp.]|nr:DUF3025 domain-containing protein [Telluria sp.]